MRSTLNRSEFFSQYVRAAWILKIRLMSSRRHLWDVQCSLIHIESGILQIRKACEVISHMCVIAAAIEHGELIPSLMKNHRVGHIFKTLKKQNKLIFPEVQTVSGACDLIEPQERTADTLPEQDADIRKITHLHNLAGNWLHDPMIFDKWPASTDDGKAALANLLHSSRAQHKWIWDRFWSHRIAFQDFVIVISLGNAEDLTCPALSTEGDCDIRDITLAFDPHFLADFSAPVDWTGYI